MSDDEHMFTINETSRVSRHAPGGVVWFTGGIALGFDRLMMVLLAEDSLRDVLAFPKSFAGKDLMGNSPCAVADEYLQTYHIKTVSASTDDGKRMS
eukprot:m.27506 g.27506  ORF g.27506 m.27506 type:complete len:96 (+) comp13429_c1_seq3:2298-2585(+)